MEEIVKSIHTQEVSEIKPSSPDFRTNLAKKLQDYAPEAIADGRVDLQKLKELLGEDTAPEGERFGLFWPGKKRAMQAAQETTVATLKPVKDASKDWDTTQNIFIEGDNLEVLKVLQKHYHGKIKLIYVDPPYNTGNDFIYPDNYREGLQSYLEFTNQVDEGGRKLKSNSEAEGRYHSNWLNMMYPRLKLARNLLEDNGVVFVSIDDHEVAQLRKLLDEIFGERNFIAQIIWRKRSAPDARTTIGTVHDYIVCYAKNIENASNAISKMGLSDNRKAAYSNPDNDPRGPWASVDMTGQTGRAPKSQYYDISLPSGRVIGPPVGRAWGLAYDTFRSMVADKRIWFGKSGDNMPRMKRFLSESEGQTVPSFWDYPDVGSNDESNKELKALFGIANIFDNPKPTKLLKRICEITTKPGDTILDFFSGSGTTAHAVMQLNSEDGGGRTHIQVQLPEPTAEDSDAFRAGYKTIAEISRERINKAGEKIKSDLSKNPSEQGKTLDVGYRTFALADTNFQKWQSKYTDDTEELQLRLEDMGKTFDRKSGQEDILTEILLKLGFSLTTSLEEVEHEGLVSWSVAEGALIAYLGEDKPTIEQIRKVTDTSPAKIVILDSSLAGDDELKTNIAQLCKTRNIEFLSA